jgi:hypothetical protein
LWRGGTTFVDRYQVHGTQSCVRPRTGNPAEKGGVVRGDSRSCPAILTGLLRGAWAEPQKRRWAARHFPGVPVITTTAALKHEFCHPGDALVDGRDKYRHLWEGAGGIFNHHRSAERSMRHCGLAVSTCRPSIPPKAKEEGRWRCRRTSVR